MRSMGVIAGDHSDGATGNFFETATAAEVRGYLARGADIGMRDKDGLSGMRPA